MSEEFNKKRDDFQDEFIDLIVHTLGINQSDNLRYDLENIFPMIYGSLRDHFVDANAMVYSQTKKELDNLATVLHRDFYAKELPEFELCDSILGVISQIDNMISGILEDKRQPHPEIKAVYEKTKNTNDLLIETIKNEVKQGLNSVVISRIRMFIYAIEKAVDG